MIMAKYRGEEKSGKLGGVIYSSWHGRPYERKMPESVANPQTEAQQAHRNAFAEISRLSSAMKMAHTVGLHSKAVREKLNTHSVFKKLNKDCYGADGIDYPRVRISWGSVTGFSITSADVNQEGMVCVAFDGNCTTENKNDEFYLFVFCPDQREGLFVAPVARSVGFVSAPIPDEWKGHTLHLYAFMKDKKGRTSNSVYVGQYEPLAKPLL